jgi:signal transduction histidine kinase
MLMSGDSTAAQSHTLATRMYSSAQRMSRMISQLSDLTRIRVGRGLPLDRKDVNVAALCASVIEELRTAHPDVTIQLTRDGDATGQWDQDRLLQVFSNLIGNAVRHAGALGPISIHVDGRHESQVAVVTRNGGVIPPEMVPVLFEPFRGSFQRGRGTEGLGLGLYISQQIVLAHGGRIEAASTETEGTRFEVTLHRSDPAGEGATRPPPVLR